MLSALGMQGLVKALDPDLACELSVVAAKYDVTQGAVSILKEGWFSGRSLYFE